MACKYYYNGKEFTESELKAAMLAGEFDREAKNMGIDIPSMKVVSGPSIRSKEQLSETERINTALVNAIKNNPSKLEEVIRSVYEDAGYHSGTLGGKSDYVIPTYYGDMPFTGYYFISNPIQAISGYRGDSNNQLRIVDFSKYNLLKPSTVQYWAMKYGLKDLTKKLKQGQLYQDALSDMSVDSWSNVFKNFFPTLLNDLKRLDGDKLFKEYKNATSSKDYKAERFETILLKNLGYEGVDVRGLKEENGEASPDKFSEGSAIFDLKENTYTSIPEAYQKAKEDGSNPELVNSVDELVQEAPSVQSKEQTAGRVTPNLSNIQGAVNATVASLPNVNIQIDGNRFNALLSDPESVRITDASGNVVALVNNGEVVVDPIATANDDASITSLGYVWMELAKGKDSAVYKQMLEAVKGTQYETDARQADADMQAQGFPAMSEEQILQRAAAEAIKDRANAYNDRTFGQKIKDAIKKFVEFLNKVFGISKDYDFLEMTIGDYADIAARSLMGARPISNVTNADLQNIDDLSPTVTVPGGMLSNNQLWLDRMVDKAGKSKYSLFTTLVPRRVSGVKALMKYWFKSDENYQKKISALNITRTRVIERQMRELSSRTVEFRKNLKAFSKGMTDAQSQELIDDVNTYLGGDQGTRTVMTPYKVMTIQDFRAKYPQATELANTIEHMRAAIDGMSTQLQMLIDKDSKLYGTIDANFGTYLTRGYAAFRNGNWNKSMFPSGLNTPLDLTSGRNPKMQAIYEAAVDYLMTNFPDMTRQEADIKLKEYARLSNEVVDPIASMESKMGKVVDDFLKARKDMPMELRAFLGEYTTPAEKFMFTMENMIKYAENKRFLNKLKDIGMNKMFFERPTGQFTELLGGSDQYSPVSGLYTTPEIADLLNNTDNSFKLPMIRQLIGLWKIGKTAYSPMSTIRNFWSNAGHTFANGYYFFNTVRRPGKEGAFKFAWKELFGNPTEFTNELVELGILNTGAFSKELRELSEKFVASVFEDPVRESLDPETMLEKAGRISSKIIKAPLKSYEFMDNWPRIAGYMTELAQCKYMFPNMSNDEVKKLAAERYRETNITYDKTPRIVKRLGQAPLVGTFVNYASEAIRTSVTIPRLALQDINEGFKTGNTNQIFVGSSRLICYSLFRTAFAGLGGIVGIAALKALGYEPPEEDLQRVIYEGSPEYAKFKSYIVVSDKPGEYEAVDISWLNPFAIYDNAYNAFMRSGEYDPEKTPLLEAVWQFAEPFLGEEAAYTLLKKWQSNDNGRGGEIYDPMDDITEQIADAIPWLMSGIAPGVSNTIYKMYNSIGNDPNYDKGKKTPSEILSNELLGMKVQKVNTVSAFSNKMYENYVPKIERQVKQIDDIIYKYETAVAKAKGLNDDNIRKDFLKDNLPDINQANIKLWMLQDDLRKYALALYSTGVPSSVIQEKMNNSLKFGSMGQAASFDVKAENIMNAQYYIRTLSPEMLEMLGYKNQKEYQDFLNSTLK